MPIPGRELVDPWVSKLLFIYIDPVVVLANKVAHLKFDQLPLLLDIDYASYITKTAFPVRIYPHLLAFCLQSNGSTLIRSLAENDVIYSGDCYTPFVRT